MKKRKHISNDFTPEELSGINNPRIKATNFLTSISVIRRYAGMNGKKYQPFALANFIKSIQRDIVSGKISKNTKYWKDIEHIQQQLIMCYELYKNYAEIEVTIGNPEKYKALAAEYKELKGMHFLKQFVSLKEKTKFVGAMKMRATNLIRNIEAYQKKMEKENFIDPVAAELELSLYELKKAKKYGRLELSEETIHGYKGLGFWPHMVSAAIAEGMRHIAHKTIFKQALSGLGKIDLSNDEVKKGIKALELVIKNKKDFHNAFKREKDNIGFISLIYGNPGNKIKGKYKGGSGIAKIIDKRNWEAETNKVFKSQTGIKVAKKLIDVIVSGQISKIIESTKRVHIQKDRYEAILSLDFEGEKITWLLTGFKIMDSGGMGKVCTKLQPTHIQPILSRLYVGAKPTNTKIQKPSHNKKDVLSGPDDDGFVRADSKAIKAPNTFRLKGEMGKFLQDIQPYKYSIVLTGDPHAGKTELVTQMANAFCDTGRKVAAFMLEQGGMQSKDTKKAIDRNVTPANKKRLFVTGEARNGIATLKKYAEEYPVIITDSFQKLGIPSTKFDSLRNEHPNTIWIVVFQQNGTGGTRGGVSVDFDSPVHIKVNKVDDSFVNNYAEMKKNRGNKLGLKYMVKARKTKKLTEEETT